MGACALSWNVHHGNSDACRRCKQLSCVHMQHTPTQCCATAPFSLAYMFCSRVLTVVCICGTRCSCRCLGLWLVHRCRCCLRQASPLVQRMPHPATHLHRWVLAAADCYYDAVSFQTLATALHAPVFASCWNSIHLRHSCLCSTALARSAKTVPPSTSHATCTSVTGCPGMTTRDCFTCWSRC
jgi:hypothetical protein